MDLEQLAIEHQKTEDRSIRNEGRIKKLESENAVLHQLATSVAVMAEQLKTMNGNVATLSGKVETLESQPSKWLDWLVKLVLGAIIGAVITLLLKTIGI